MLKIISRWILALQICAVDIEIDGYTKALATDLPPELRRCLESSRKSARAERHGYQKRHAATFPIGERKIYNA